METNDWLALIVGLIFASPVLAAFVWAVLKRPEKVVLKAKPDGPPPP